MTGILLRVVAVGRLVWRNGRTALVQVNAGPKRLP
jgi:hypothetical protein